MLSLRFDSNLQSLSCEATEHLRIEDAKKTIDNAFKVFTNLVLDGKSTYIIELLHGIYKHQCQVHLTNKVLYLV